MKKILSLLSVALFVATAVYAEEAWLPQVTRAEKFNGRDTEWYTHGAREAWGCKDPNQKDTFIVVHAKTGDAKNMPLYVVLHSAGHNVHTALACTTQKGNHDIYHAPDGFYALYLDCAANRNTDWWWGIEHYKGRDLAPVEKRCVDTIQWVIKKYNIDPDRVYCSGNSMGGSGTLGFGLRHGDIFAAIKANVPARVEHATARMYLDAEVPAGVKFPDPPVCVDYSGQNDGWSKGHDFFYRAMADRKYNIIGYWGSFGHANNHEEIRKINDLIETFDWLSIVRNAAYPVFTNTSCDDKLPWPECIDKAAGQVNGYFRWKNISDKSGKMEMSLYIIRNEDLGSTMFTAPAEATTNVSIRRLQKLKISAGDTVKWSFGDKKGTVTADANGIVTINGLTLAAEPGTLTLSK